MQLMCFVFLRVVLDTSYTAGTDVVLKKKISRDQVQRLGLDTVQQTKVYRAQCNHSADANKGVNGKKATMMYIVFPSACMLSVSVALTFTEM